MLDFMNNIDGDVVIQVLPTSPLVTSAEIRKFVAEMETGLYDTLISVEHKQIACLYKDREINFDKLAPNPPSQTMTPIKAYATALMGWRYDKFKEDMRRFGSGYHGGLGPTGYFELRGLSTLDIDREEDFRLVERIILSQEIQINPAIRYYGEL
jgi:CMP-N,N'-diacetyllegionaminic acid synthase